MSKMIADTQGNLLIMFDDEEGDWKIKTDDDSDEELKALIRRYLKIDDQNFDWEELIYLQSEKFFTEETIRKIDKHLEDTEDWIDYYYPLHPMMVTMNDIIEAYFNTYIY